MTSAIEIWTDPVAMEPGAPEPVELFERDTLWVAYRAIDPAFPGWGHPDTDAYLERTQDREPFGVLRFDIVAHHHLGPPSDERLREHPLWGAGLVHYSFHRLEAEDGRTRWIVTFHDATLDVTARTATASSLIFAPDRIAAIEKRRQRS